MTINKQLISNFPKNINKDGTIFKALIANSSKTGAIEQILQEMKDYMSEWVDTPNIYEQTGDMLAKTVDFFSYLEAFTDETETSLKNRFSAIFVRNNDTVWGTPYNIKRVFEQYFPSGSIYLAENVNDTSTENLLDDMDFTSETSEYWTMTDCEVSTEARFSKTYGVILSSSTSDLYQTVTISNTDSVTYFLHFFLNGSVKVRLTASDGTYWNNTSKEWQSDDTLTTFTSTEWENKSIWCRVDSSITSIKIEFVGIDDTTGYIDYVRLFEKQPYSSFCVIAQFEGTNAGTALALAEGTDDTETPIPESYKNKGYYDGVYMTGVSAGFAEDIYNDLLDLLKAQGVKAYIEIVNKDYIEE